LFDLAAGISSRLSEPNNRTDSRLPLAVGGSVPKVRKQYVRDLREQWMFDSDLQLSNNWIKWKNPAFISEDGEWTQFLGSQAKRYPGPPRDLDTIVRSAHSIKILKQNSRFEFIPKFETNPNL
jgi:hypothetical protein